MLRSAPLLLKRYKLAQRDRVLKLTAVIPGVGQIRLMPDNVHRGVGVAYQVSRINRLRWVSGPRRWQAGGDRVAETGTVDGLRIHCGQARHGVGHSRHGPRNARPLTGWRST